MGIVVEAPARLHLGFLDLGGQCGRIFGSIGVAIERPRCALEVRLADGVETEGEEREESLALLEHLRRHLHLEHGVAVRVLASIPRHVGLGSGTQLTLSLAFGIARLFGLAVPVEELARLAGRGRRSGVGIATFEKGGFVVDAGRPFAPADGPAAAGLAGGAVPLAILHHPVPEDWFFVLVMPEEGQGVSGELEERVFADLPAMTEDAVGKICRLTLMQLIPGLLQDDIRGFGEAVTAIQVLMGEHFAPVQGGIYATAMGKDVAEFALREGASGVGQSSWGPTMFALVRGEDAAADLAARIAGHVGEGAATILTTRASNRGASWRQVA